MASGSVIGPLGPAAKAVGVRARGRALHLSRGLGLRLLCVALLSCAACGPSVAPVAPTASAATPTTSPEAGVPRAAASAGAPPAREQVRIGYPATSTQFLSLFVAQDQGFYARHGIDAEIMLASAQVAITG